MSSLFLSPNLQQWKWEFDDLLKQGEFMYTELPEALQEGLQGEGAGWVSCVTWWMFQSGQELLVG